MGLFRRTFTREMKIAAIRRLETGPRSPRWHGHSRCLQRGASTTLLYSCLRRHEGAAKSDQSNLGRIEKGKGSVEISAPDTEDWG
jgi:hypothetical protein